jgi:hypothetical protein
LAKGLIFTPAPCKKRKERGTPQWQQLRSFLRYTFAVERVGHPPVEEALKDGVTEEEIEEAVSGVAKGNPNPERAWDSVQRFYTATCEVRVNKVTGTIVTVISKIKR